MADGFTLQIRALLLPKPSTRLLHSRSQRHLDISGHGLLPRAHSAHVLRVAHHHLDLLNGFLAVVERAGDILRQSLDYPLLFLPSVLIAESR